MECTCPKCGLVWKIGEDENECECFGMEVEGDETYVVGCGNKFIIEVCDVIGE